MPSPFEILIARLDRIEAKVDAALAVPDDDPGGCARCLADRRATEWAAREPGPDPLVIPFATAVAIATGRHLAPPDDDYECPGDCGRCLRGDHCPRFNPRLAFHPAS